MCELNRNKEEETIIITFGSSFSYNIIFFLMTYVVPMLLMGVCYSRMGKHLWGSEIVGEETPALLKNYQNKKKVTQLLNSVSNKRNNPALPEFLPHWDG